MKHLRGRIDASHQARDRGQVTAEYAVGAIAVASIGSALLVISRDPGLLEIIREILEMGWYVIRDIVFTPLRTP